MLLAILRCNSALTVAALVQCNTDSREAVKGNTHDVVSMTRDPNVPVMYHNSIARWVKRDETLGHTVQQCRPVQQFVALYQLVAVGFWTPIFIKWKLQILNNFDTRSPPTRHVIVFPDVLLHMRDIWEDDNMVDVTCRAVNTIAKIDIFSVLGVNYSAKRSWYQIPRDTNRTSPDNRDYTKFDCIKVQWDWLLNSSNIIYNFTDNSGFPQDVWIIQYTLQLSSNN